MRAAAPALRSLAAGLALAVALQVALPGRVAAVGDAGSGYGDVTFDLLLVRPLGLARLVAGAGFFALSAPFVAPAVGLDEIRERFVTEPYRFTFVRPLGDLGS